MCFSESYSALALLLGIVGQVVLYNRNSAEAKAFAMAISAVTLMQLYELVMWRNPCTLDHADGINQTISRIAMITNISQPLATAVSML